MSSRLLSYADSPQSAMPGKSPGASRVPCSRTHYAVAAMPGSLGSSPHNRTDGPEDAAGMDMTGTPTERGWTFTYPRSGHRTMAPGIRPLHDGTMNALLATRPRRLPRWSWGILLPLVMALSLTLWGGRYSTLVIVLLAVIISYTVPAVAADLLRIALINLGVHV